MALTTRCAALLSHEGGFGFFAYGFNGAYIDRTGGDTYRSMVGFASVADGTSHTASFTEWVIGSTRNPSPASSKLLYQLPQNNEGDAYEFFVSQCGSLDERTTKRVRGKTAEWIDGTYGNTLAHFAIPPGGHSCKNGESLAFGAVTAGSYHRDGVNLLFLDGHVAPISTSIDPRDWRALSTRAGGELVRDD